MDLIVAACLVSMPAQFEADRAVELAILAKPTAQTRVCEECSRLRQSAAEPITMQQSAALEERIPRIFEDRPRIQNLRTRFFNVAFFPFRAVRSLNPFGWSPIRPARRVNDG